MSSELDERIEQKVREVLGAQMRTAGDPRVSAPFDWRAVWQIAGMLIILSVALAVAAIPIVVVARWIFGP